jgi:hypothetical protein
VPVPVLLPWLVGFVVLTIGGERLELARLAMGPRAGAVLVTLAVGLLAGVVAALLWLGEVPVPLLLPWLVGFVVLTIGGERLELARLAMGPRAGGILVLLSVGLMAGIVAALLWPAAGTALLGTALLALVGWLAAHDVARHTVRSRGLPRYMAACMLAGYAWLGVAGATWLVGGPATAGARYDAVIHAVFLGFTLSMIMAHAPVILPTVLRRPLPYSPVLALPPVLLHASLVVRLWLGDAHGVTAAWRWGGVLNIAAVLLFVALAAGSVARAGRRGSTTRGTS